MNQNTTTPVIVKPGPRPGLIAGGILILVGLLALAQQLLPPGWPGELFLPALALIFIAAGLIYNKIGLLIPGGILAGVGVGAWLQNRVALPAAQDGALFLLAFAGGWALITLLSVILHLRDSRQAIAWWALIPGGLIGLVGAALFIGGGALQALELLGQGWPVILIALGLYILLRRKEIRNRES